MNKKPPLAAQIPGGNAPAGEKWKRQSRHRENLLNQTDPRIQNPFGKANGGQGPSLDKKPVALFRPQAASARSGEQVDVDEEQDVGQRRGDKDPKAFSRKQGGQRQKPRTERSSKGEISDQGNKQQIFKIRRNSSKTKQINDKRSSAQRHGADQEPNTTNQPPQNNSIPASPSGNSQFRPFSTKTSFGRLKQEPMVQNTTPQASEFSQNDKQDTNTHNQNPSSVHETDSFIQNQPYPAMEAYTFAVGFGNYGQDGQYEFGKNTFPDQNPKGQEHSEFQTGGFSPKGRNSQIQQHDELDMIKYDMMKGLGVDKAIGHRDEANIDGQDVLRESYQRPLLSADYNDRPSTRNSQRGRNRETRLLRRDLCDATPSFFNGGIESKQLKATAAIQDSEESGSEPIGENEIGAENNIRQQVNQADGNKQAPNIGTPNETQKADEAMASSPEALGRKSEGPGHRELGRSENWKVEHSASVDEAKYNNQRVQQLHDTSERQSDQHDAIKAREVIAGCVGNEEIPVEQAQQNNQSPKKNIFEESQRSDAYEDDFEENAEADGVGEGQRHLWKKEREVIDGSLRNEKQPDRPLQDGLMQEVNSQGNKKESGIEERESFRHESKKSMYNSEQPSIKQPALAQGPRNQQPAARMEKRDSLILQEHGASKATPQRTRANNEIIIEDQKDSKSKRSTKHPAGMHTTTHSQRVGDDQINFPPVLQAKRPSFAKGPDGDLRTSKRSNNRYSVGAGQDDLSSISPFQGPPPQDSSVFACQELENIKQQMQSQKRARIALNEALIPKSKNSGRSGKTENTNQEVRRSMEVQHVRNQMMSPGGAEFQDAEIGIGGISGQAQKQSQKVRTKRERQTLNATMMPPLPNLAGAQKKKVADPFEKRQDFLQDGAGDQQQPCPSNYNSANISRQKATQIMSKRNLRSSSASSRRHNDSESERIFPPATTDQGVQQFLDDKQQYQN